MLNIILVMNQLDHKVLHALDGEMPDARGLVGKGLHVINQSLSRFQEPRRGQLITWLQKVLKSLDAAGQGGLLGVINTFDQSLARFQGPRRGELMIWIQNILRSLDGAGQGGGGMISDGALQKNLADPGLYDVKNHLQGFTGLGNVELHRRLARCL
jgi:hypothetical protein